MKFPHTFRTASLKRLESRSQVQPLFRSTAALKFNFEFLGASNQPADSTLLRLGQVPHSGVHYLSGNHI